MLESSRYEFVTLDERNLFGVYNDDFDEIYLKCEDGLVMMINLRMGQMIEVRLNLSQISLTAEKSD